MDEEAVVGVGELLGGGVGDFGEDDGGEGGGVGAAGAGGGVFGEDCVAVGYAGAGGGRLAGLLIYGRMLTGLLEELR